MTTSKKAYGIDLGTTYSAIAYINDDGKAEIIKNADGDDLTPSVVYFESENNVIAGEVAKNSALESPEDAKRVVTSIKRHMHHPNHTVDIFGNKYDPSYISSVILKKVIEDARAAGHDVQDVVITCPEYFDNTARTMTRRAGEALGVRVLDVLDEPVAAALDYAMQEPVSAGQTVLVYDLGGGTFDVTVVRISQDRNNIKVVCSEGNHQLGGKDWDERIENYLLEEFKSRTGGTDIRKDERDKSEDKSNAAKEFLFRFGVQAEECKKMLTQRESVSQVVLYETSRVKIEISREDFERKTEDLLNSTLMLTGTLLKTAEGEGVQHIDTVLLVGGSTRMPQIEKGLRAKFAGKFDTIRSFAPDDAVARGAAKFAQSILDDGGTDTGKGPRPIVERAASHTYGVNFYDTKKDQRYVGNLILRNTALPARGETIANVVSPTDVLRMALYESNTMDRDSYDVQKHKLLVEKEWNLGRIVDPKEGITEILSLQEDGTLRLFCKLPNAPEFELEWKVEGDFGPKEMEKRRDKLKHTIVQ